MIFIKVTHPVRDFSIPNVTDKVLQIIISYNEYVNHVIWKKTLYYENLPNH